jgi:hypothetical protein
MNTNYAEYMEAGGASKFKADMASAIGIDEKYLDIKELTEGSVVADYVLQIDASSELTLDDLADKQNEAYDSGALAKGLGVEITGYTRAVAPVKPVPVVAAEPEPEV